MTITIEEVMLRKQEAEQVIRTTLQRFTEDTGLEVHDIDLYTEWRLCQPPKPHVIGVSLDIRFTTGNR